MSSQIQDQTIEMNQYQREQLHALGQVVDKIGFIDANDRGGLFAEIEPYMEFRNHLKRYLKQHFAHFCTQSCFKSRTSACCSKDGIITFWGDMVVNVHCSNQKQIADLVAAIKKPLYPNKCIYLGPRGCVWKVPPLGCALFLCDAVQSEVFDGCPHLKETWEQHKAAAKKYRWPDRPVLFDRLEAVFMAAGCRSPLMYINTSPGLLRIKQESMKVKI